MDPQTAIPRWLWDDQGIYPYVLGLCKGPQVAPTWAEDDSVGLEIQDHVMDWLFGEAGSDHYQRMGGGADWIAWAQRMFVDEWQVEQTDWARVRRDLLALENEPRVVLVTREARR